MSDESDFDVIVVGAGPVGENVADRVVRGRLTAAIVESELVGGECSYWACIPSKSLLRPVQARDEAGAVDGARQAITGPLDVAAVLGRRNSFVHDWHDDGQVEWLKKERIALFRGHGRLTGPCALSVQGPDGEVALNARHAVVIATGSAAALPPVEGLADAKPWTSRDATSAQAAPDSLLVLGGGVVGCEMAQAWSALGTRVTVVELSEHLLPGVERFAGNLLAEAMKERGIELHLGVSASAARRLPDGRVSLTLGEGRVLEAEELLVAAGRKPRTEDIGLETVGLEPGTWLAVDDTMLVLGVGGEWLYATGDVNHRALLTHQGKYQARVCGDVIVARASGLPVPYQATSDHTAVPSVVFTHPEVASVGLTEARARETGIDVRVVDYQIGDTAGGAIFADGYKGQARMVVDDKRRVIVGATFVGAGVAELLHSATIAVVAEVPLDRLWHAVPSFPTMSEVWLRLLETYGL
jgi:pyruvate/2-oxoglutarate dehydrogenase complex dihydrolipoamide dehydrogenase (E3) component